MKFVFASMAREFVRVADGTYELRGIQRAMLCALPLRMPVLLFVSLVGRKDEPRREMKLGVELIHEGGTRLLAFEATHSDQSTQLDRLRWNDITINLGDVTFPWHGEYEFQVSLDGIVVGSALYYLGPMPADGDAALG